MRKVIRLLNLRHLRRQPLRTALAAVSVAAGVALLVAVLTEGASYTASLSGFSRQLAGPTPLRIVGADNHGGLDQSVLSRVSETPGVAAAVPVVQTIAQVLRRDGSHAEAVAALGVDCRVEAIIGDFGCSAQAVGSAPDTAAPVVSAALAQSLGPTGLIETDLNEVSLAGAAALPQLNQVDFGRVVVFPLPEAQRLFMRSGQLDVIYVKPAPGTDLAALKSSLAGVVGPQDRLLSASEPPPFLFNGNFLLPLLGLIALAALAVGALMVFNTMALSLEERRRDLAIAGALGATPRTVVVGALAEAAALGVGAGVLGAAAGVLLAFPIVGSLSDQVEQSAGAAIGVHVAAWPLVVGILGGVAVSMAAAWRPARRASRISLTAELHQRGPATDAPARARLRNAVIVTLVGVGGVGLAWLAQRHGGLDAWQSPVGVVGVLVAFVGFFAAAALWTPLVLVGLRRGLHRFAHQPSSLSLALTNLVRNPGRTAAMAVAVAAAVGVGAALGDFLPADQAAVTHLVDPSAANRVFVSTLNPNNSALVDSKVTPAMVSAIRGLPGVARIDRDFFMIAGQGPDQLSVVAYDGTSPRPYPLLEGNSARSASSRGEAMVGAALARSRHLHLGSTVSIATPGGVRTVAVGGIWADPNNLGRTVTLPSTAVLEAFFGRQPPSELFVAPKPGVSVSELAATIRAARLAPGMFVLTPHRFSITIANEVATYITPFWALQRMLLSIALIATLATLLLAGLQRRREHGVLSAVGMGPRALAAMTLTEAGLVGAIGSLLGIGASVLAGLALIEMAQVLFGVRPPFIFDLAPGFIYAALATVIVTIGALLPARRAQSMPVVEALRYE